MQVKDTSFTVCGRVTGGQSSAKPGLPCELSHLTNHTFVRECFWGVPVYLLSSGPEAMPDSCGVDIQCTTAHSVIVPAFEVVTKPGFIQVAWCNMYTGKTQEHIKPTLWNVTRSGTKYIGGHSAAVVLLFNSLWKDFMKRIKASKHLEITVSAKITLRLWSRHSPKSLFLFYKVLECLCQVHICTLLPYTST